MAGVDIYRESILGQTRDGTHLIRLDPEGMKDLLRLFEVNGADVSGTRPKKLRNSVDF